MVIQDKFPSAKKKAVNQTKKAQAVQEESRKKVRTRRKLMMLRKVMMRETRRKELETSRVGLRLSNQHSSPSSS